QTNRVDAQQIDRARIRDPRRRCRTSGRRHHQRLPRLHQLSFRPCCPLFILRLPETTETKKIFETIISTENSSCRTFGSRVGRTKVALIFGLATNKKHRALRTLTTVEKSAVKKKRLANNFIASKVGETGLSIAENPNGLKTRYRSVVTEE